MIGTTDFTDYTNKNNCHRGPQRITEVKKFEKAKWKNVRIQGYRDTRAKESKVLRFGS
jgi:hypothetical protein